MGITLITPSYAQEIANRSKPAIVSICKTGIVFNAAATQLLALKPEIKFILEEESGAIFFKEVINGEGFTIKSTLNGSARLNNQTLLFALKAITNKKVKSFKFEIGELKNAKRSLTILGQ